MYLVPFLQSVCQCGCNWNSGACQLPPPFCFPRLACVWMSDRVLGWGGRAVREMNVVVFAPRFFIRAQWSGDLWVWLHPLRLAAEPQRCGTQDGRITTSAIRTHMLEAYGSWKTLAYKDFHCCIHKTHTINLQWRTDKITSEDMFVVLFAQCQWEFT